MVSACPPFFSLLQIQWKSRPVLTRTQSKSIKILIFLFTPIFLKIFLNFEIFARCHPSVLSHHALGTVECDESYCIERGAIFGRRIHNLLTYVSLVFIMYQFIYNSRVKSIKMLIFFENLLIPTFFFTITDSMRTNTCVNPDIIIKH
jgi:hypothetical protein